MIFTSRLVLNVGKREFDFHFTSSAKYRQMDMFFSLYVIIYQVLGIIILKVKPFDKNIMLLYIELYNWKFWTVMDINSNRRI